MLIEVLFDLGVDVGRERYPGTVTGSVDDARSDQAMRCPDHIGGGWWEGADSRNCGTTSAGEEWKVREADVVDRQLGLQLGGQGKRVCSAVAAVENAEHAGLLKLAPSEFPHLVDQPIPNGCDLAVIRPA